MRTRRWAAACARPLAIAGLLASALAGAAGPAAAAAPGRPATPALIERDARAGAIARDTANLYLAYALGRPGELPAAYRSDTPWDGTLPLRHLLETVKEMNPGPRRDAVEAIIEPAALQSTGTCSSSTGTLANDTQSAHFYVQYGTIGAGLDINAYVASLEGSWTKEVTSFGWAAPPVATTPAPGSKYHVRIDNLSSGLYGYVSPSGTHAGLVGNNPNTSWSDGDAYASCMVLNEDYSGFPSPPQASLDSTTAHEFNHSLQFGYGALNGSNVPDNDFVEGGATWMEDEVYDSANDNYNYLWPVFADGMGDYDASPYPYWITFRGLTERYGTGAAGGGEQVMQDFWEETSKNTGNNLTAMQTALANRGTTLAAAFHAYAIAVKFNRTCGGGYVYPYCFEEGAGYLTEAGATAVHKSISAVGGSTTNARVEDNYALNWVSLPSTGGPYDVTLDNTSSGGQLRGTVACDTGSAISLSPLPAIVGAGVGTTLAGFSPSACAGVPILVVTNQAQTAANPTTSSSRTYKVTTTGSGPPPPPTHQLTVAKSGSGTVTSSPAGINCGADCSQSYDEGTPVTLSAQAAAGWSFSGWSGDCSGQSCSLTMNADKSVTATFTQNPPPPTHQLTVAKSGSGTVTSSPAGINCGADCSQSYDEGTPVTLSAQAAAGWSFSGWSGDCSGQSCSLTMNADKSVTATFTQNPPPPTHQLTVAKSGSGTVTSSPAGINCGADCSQSYDEGTPVTLSAQAAAGWSFSGWSGDCSGQSCSLTMNADKSVTATFTQNPPPPPPPDVTAPVQGKLVLSSPSFRAARSGPSATSAALAGTKVGYTLSEAATTLFKVERATVGRLVGGRCVRTTRANADRRHCTRWVLMRGRFTRAGQAGQNSFRFMGRLGGRTLPPGRYRLLARSTDLAGNRSGTRRARFRILGLTTRVQPRPRR